jgi:cell wall-associated NlpC family hydrolase
MLSIGYIWLTQVPLGIGTAVEAAMKYALYASLIMLFMLSVLQGCTSLDRRSNSFPTGTAPHTGEQITPARARIVESATAMLGTPYLYGGSSPERGFDCSGLVLYSHNRAGIQVPRTAAQQLRHSRKITPDQLQPGDLLFFRIETKPSHVSIYLGDGIFIHAPSSGGRVRTESLTNPYWNQRLVETGSFIF